MFYFLTYTVRQSFLDLCLKYSINFNTEAKEMCNTAIEREFCWLSEDNFENCEKSFYEAQFSFFWQVAESANKPIFKVLVNLGHYPIFGSYLGI